MPIIAGINYKDSGGSGQPIICLHGIGGNDSSFAAQYAELGSDFRVIAWNMSGYNGSTTLLDVTFENLSNSLIAFMNALDISSAHIIGQSIGGMLAQEIAILHPHRVRSLILIATSAAFGGRDNSFKTRFLATRLAPLDAGKTMPELAEEFVPEITGSNTSQQVLKEAVAAMSAVPEATYRQIIKCLVTFNRRDDQHLLTMPVCLIAGEMDQNAPPTSMQKMSEHIPHSQFHIVEKAGHLVNSEASDIVNAIIRNFLLDQG
ncbi:alpha/beta fold hydrolase [Candidatus Puniceispirillum sp.]|uniref:alpha/beta fold hydrolase n=1 Tax=Candidatus Puniceispirillum sp. TaxID=2026719 RepID=UPI001EB449E8|nr:alpha/beta hydrolase [Candidatus Puniceispirillum sp.]